MKVEMRHHNWEERGLKRTPPHKECHKEGQDFDFASNDKGGRSTEGKRVEGISSILGNWNG
jgi:hypothetical protein